MTTIFEGSNALIRHAWEATKGITPYAATWHDFRFNSEALAAQLPTIQPNSLRGGRQRTRGLPSKITVAGPVAVDLEPQGHGYLLAAFQKGSPAVTTLTGRPELPAQARAVLHHGRSRQNLLASDLAQQQDAAAFARLPGIGLRHHRQYPIGHPRQLPGRLGARQLLRHGHRRARGRHPHAPDSAWRPQVLGTRRCRL